MVDVHRIAHLRVRAFSFFLFNRLEITFFIFQLVPARVCLDIYSIWIKLLVHSIIARSQTEDVLKFAAHQVCERLSKYRVILLNIQFHFTLIQYLILS